jgi:predicted RNase H-like HicB family nuclease
MADQGPTEYVATYTHDDGAWIVQFRDPDVATFGRTLPSAKRYARSALAVYLELDDLTAAGVEVVDHVRLPTEISAEINRLIDQRSKVEAFRAEVAEATRRAAADLRRMGLSTRDVGVILGISLELAWPRSTGSPAQPESGLPPGSSETLQRAGRS